MCETSGWSGWLLLGFLVESGADDLGAEGVSVGWVEGFSVVKLEMGGEGQHKEAVYSCDGQAGMFSFAFAGAAEGAEPFYGGG